MSDGCYVITEDQIDKAWRAGGSPVMVMLERDGDERVPFISANELGIVACKKCGGAGIPTPYEVGSGESCRYCDGHGWVMEKKDES